MDSFEVLQSQSDFFDYLKLNVPLGSKRIRKSDYINICNWVLSNKQLCQEWPLCILYKKLKDIYLEQNNKENILIQKYSILSQTIKSISRYTNSNLQIDKDIFSKEKIYIKNSEFRFTGDFIYGESKLCIADTKINGGLVSYNTLCIGYLVVGSLGSKYWKHGNYGNKIQNAILRTESRWSNIQIVSEEDWYWAMQYPEEMPVDLFDKKYSYIRSGEFEDNLVVLWEGNLSIEFQYKKIYEKDEPVSKRRLELLKILMKPNFSSLYLWGTTSEGERTFHVERIKEDIYVIKRKEYFSLEAFLQSFGIEYHSSR